MKPKLITRDYLMRCCVYHVNIWPGIHADGKTDDRAVVDSILAETSGHVVLDFGNVVHAMSSTVFPKRVKLRNAVFIAPSQVEIAPGVIAKGNVRINDVVLADPDPLRGIVFAALEATKKKTRFRRERRN